MRYAHHAAAACTEDQLQNAMTSLDAENPTASKYLRENVGLDCFSRVRLVRKGGRLYGKESGVMSNDTECYRFKQKGIRDSPPLRAVILYHQLVMRLVNDCITHARFLKVSKKIDSAFYYLHVFISNFCFIFYM